MLMLHRSERGWDPLEGGRLRSERPRLVAVLLTLILDHARRAETHDVNQVVRTRPVTADTALSKGALRMALGIAHRRPRPERALGGSVDASFTDTGPRTLNLQMFFTGP